MKKILLLLSVLSCGVVFAQAPAVPSDSPEAANDKPADAEEAQGITIGEFFDRGGPLMWPLLLLSILAVADIGYLFYTLRDSVTAPRPLVNDVMDNVRAGSPEEARKACDYRKCPFSHIAMTAIDAEKNLLGGDPLMLNSIIEGEGARQAARLQGRVQWLLDISSVAPMIGLLGTVLGMLSAFQGVGEAATPVVLGRGISLALITTIAGLLVAVPSICFYAWFRRQAEKQVALLECLAADLAMSLLSQRKKP